MQPAFFLLEKNRPKEKFKTQKRNSSDFEVFNCKISMENLINDQYVAKGWLNFCTSYLVHSQIWLNFPGMIVTFSASSYRWMTATFWYKQNIRGHTVVQIMGEWEVMETYPYLLLKNQEQVFTAGSAKVCLLLFSSSVLGPIYLLLKIDAWYRSPHALRVRAMHVLSSQWARTVHYLERFITKMCVVPASDRHIFFGQWGEKKMQTLLLHCLQSRLNLIYCLPLSDHGYPWLWIQVQTSVGRFSLFLWEPLVPVFGAGFKNRLDSFFFFITIINAKLNLNFLLFYLLKLSVKSDKDDTRTVCLVTWGTRFQKQENKVHWA